MVSSQPQSLPAKVHASEDAKGGGGDLRARIIRVATGLFASQGYTATALRQVAEAAAWTKPALYYHFDSKSALFLRLIEHETDRIADVLRQQLGAPDTVRQRMLAGMHAYLAHVRQNIDALTLLHRAEHHREPGQPAFDMRSVRQMMLSMVTELLREGVECGEIRSDVRLDDALSVLVGAVEQCCTMLLLEGVPIDQDYPDRVLELLFGGLSP